MLQMNRWLKPGALALTVALVASSIAEAQEREERGQGERRQGQGQGQGGQRGGRGGGFPGGGRGPGGLDKLALVGIAPVRTELKISEEQMFFIEELLTDHREKSREVFSGIDFGSFRDKPEEERRKMMEDLQAKRSKIVKQNEEVLAEFLTNQQNKRLGEITLQLQGVRALASDGVAKELGLSGAQRQKVQDALEAGNEERQKLTEELRASFGGRGGRPGGGGRPEGGRPEGGRPEGGRREGGRPEGGRPEGGRPQGGGFDFNAMREKMDEIRKKTDSKVLAVLSDEQKKKFDGMKGAAFELDMRSAFGGRGGQGGGRGGQGGGRGGEGGRGGDGGGRGGDGGARPQRPAAE